MNVFINMMKYIKYKKIFFFNIHHPLIHPVDFKPGRRILSQKKLKMKRCSLTNKIQALTSMMRNSNTSVKITENVV